MKSALTILSVAVALSVSLPLEADSVLFSNLGTGSNVYNTTGLGSFGLGWGINGSAAPNTGHVSDTDAALFSVAGAGSLPVTQIDLAVTNINFLEGSSDTFQASIWTDNAGLPGEEVSGAFWSLSSTPNTSNTITCCSLVSVTGITDVDLTGGNEYFMILAPQSLTDSSDNVWDNVSLSEIGLNLVSNDGGATWISTTLNAPIGGFDVLSTTPEPATWPLMGVGFALVAFLKRAGRTGC